MKKTHLIGIIFLICFIISSPRVFAQSSYPECNDLYDQKEGYYNSWLSSSYSDPDRQTYYQNYLSYSTAYTNCVNKKTKDFSNFFDKGIKSYNNGDYLSAESYFAQALGIIPNDASSKTNLILCYRNLGQGYFDKNEYSSAIEYYQKYLNYTPNNYAALHNIGLAYFNKGNLNDALSYFERALDVTFDKNEIAQINAKIVFIKSAKEDNEAKKNAKTNDPWDYKQYYLEQLNVYEARKSLSSPKRVVIAIIDDGVNINHPDLSSNIWINKGETPGNKKDDDKNGYIDDYNGRNFVYNSNNLIPLGTHGTMVAGIIGAGINNNEGIAGIMPSVKIMPIGVFDAYGDTTSDKVIKAVKYAINNGANIINLSLGGHQFSYTNAYDDVIKQAYEKGIIVVVAAGNGDVLSDQTEGVNTDINKISPVCNEGGNKKRIIGVGAFDEEGYRARRSNYGIRGKGCVDFSAPGVNILSTSILDYASSFGMNYNMAGGTSFASPMVAGIIGLGYSQFGSKLTPDRAYNGLENSLVVNSIGNYVIDTAKFIEFVRKQIEDENKTPTQWCEESFGNNILGDGTKDNNGSYNCYCKKGYAFTEDKKSCVELKPFTGEQATSAIKGCKSTYGENSTSYGELLVGDIGGYACACNEGFSRTKKSKEITCNKINKNSANQAISYLYVNGLTSHDNEADFKTDAYITREQAAKFLSEFSITVLGLSVDESKSCSFKDIKKADTTLREYITKVCQLGAMNGANGSFRPSEKIRKSEIIAVIMRLKYGDMNVSGAKWYQNYIDKANEIRILDNLDSGYDQFIKRGDVALLLYRAGLVFTAE